jgi:uncharacterized protein (DUF4415 family)
MFLKTKTGRLIKRPSHAEEKAINTGIAAEPDTVELTEEWFDKAKRGRPILPSSDRRRRVNLMLDPDIADQLRQTKNMSALVNQLLRANFGK